MSTVFLVSSFGSDSRFRDLVLVAGGLSTTQNLSDSAGVRVGGGISARILCDPCVTLIICGPDGSREKPSFSEHYMYLPISVPHLYRTHAMDKTVGWSGVLF